MYKKIVKGVLVCVSVVFFALVIGYVTYFTTVNFISRSMLGGDESGNTAEAVLSDTVPKDDELSPTPANASGTYYLAKLNGDKIEIYSAGSSSNYENQSNQLNQGQFLYSFTVYVPDIPFDDATALKQGIRFNTKEELAAFEEDFNS